MGIGKWITSPKFQVGQHDWAICYYPQGNNKDDKGKYVSIFLELIQRGSVDITTEFGFQLLDKHGNVSPTSLKLLHHTFTSKESNWGIWDFFERTRLEQTYIKDDCFILRVSITVQSARDIISMGFTCERLQKFREENEHTDVTFDVDGKIFVSHRLILAAHSPVFKAELFGSMVESNMDCIIKINEMIPSVFKAMLDFMYNSSFSVNEKLVDCEVPMSATAFLQHLLVAADRYAVEKLKAICEYKLVESISLDTVLSTLELAEMNNCRELKNKCLQFIDKA
ncbi:BTB/POZ and MATH domain-containing protein 2-like isoform X2 [Carex littledalei]|uniref:BTB/POZ and MATH domain-containing protein 2-like isoform X2 n=1 Tax=Carex littledalei TaxID=544730 RepID=A0A833RPL9_9POAL|nr:BTB/POZ and MATH domain-containing protein 2-like isoform X2 [Carex littledalei]